jgi:hypothetical protein
MIMYFYDVIPAGYKAARARISGFPYADVWAWNEVNAVGFEVTMPAKKAELKAAYNADLTASGIPSSLYNPLLTALRVGAPALSVATSVGLGLSTGNDGMDKAKGMYLAWRNADNRSYESQDVTVDILIPEGKEAPSMRTVYTIEELNAYIKG